jgi:hypothetical protein
MGMEVSVPFALALRGGRQDVQGRLTHPGVRRST